MRAKQHRCLPRGFPGAVFLLAVLTLSACGTAASRPQGGTAPPSPTASPPALAVALGHLDRLVVLRSDAFPQNHIRFSFPAKVTVTDPAKVQAVARALLALPVMPNGTFSVPIDLGVTYRLLFATGAGNSPR